MKSRHIQESRLAKGIHPFGMRLADNGEACRSCDFAVKDSSHSKHFWKCSQMADGGMATDLKVRWPACELWKPFEKTEAELG